VAIYSSFLQRAFDQIIHDVALQHLHVVFALDRAGLVGADGPTHHGTFDLSYLRMVPGMVIMAPRDESELRDMLYTAVMHEGGPVAVRYPRGAGFGVALKPGFDALPIGKAVLERPGKDIAVLAIGDTVVPARLAAEELAGKGVEAEVFNMRFVKPLDEECLRSVASRFRKILTVEHNTVLGGFGSAVSEFLAAERLYGVEVRHHGLPDRFVDHGSPAELAAEVGLDPAGISRVIVEFLNRD
jgi:1-deoxy-D-xylulose-5-phosphate synthase